MSKFGNNLEIILPTEIESSIAETSLWASQNRNAEIIRERLKQGGCYIYGAGGYGQMVAAKLKAQGYHLHGFIDTFRGGGGIVADVPSHLPQEITEEETRGRTLILAVNNFKVPVGPIVDWARTQPFADLLFLSELPDILDPELGTYWQSTRQLMPDNAAAIAKLHDLLGDQTSRDILAGLVRFRITGRPEDHPPVDRERQYFPIDLPLDLTELHVVDCGAFPGDMVEATAMAGLKLSHWYAFEPDTQNFVVLNQVAQSADVDCAALFPCGVGDTTGLIRFASGSADASRALDDDNAATGITVPVVRVDDVVRAQRIDMVKLDIEGFEAQAIDGMAQLLGKHRPRLAVAIYHKPEDLWTLPFKIADMFPGARFAIRQHGHNGYDTVLYADL